MSRTEHQDSQMTDVASVHEEQHDSQTMNEGKDGERHHEIGAATREETDSHKDQEDDMLLLLNSDPEDDEDGEPYDGYTDNNYSEHDIDEEDWHYNSGYSDGYGSDNDYGEAEWLDHTDDMADDGEQFEFKYIENFTDPTSAQEQSGLMSLPEELLNQIYQYVFTDEEGDKLYDFDTCYRRPGYFAPRETHTSFLRSCQLVYRNAWFMPWTLSRKTIYLA